jgi:hypothetical protein
MVKEHAVKAIIGAARDAGLHVRSYSGRAMYGDKCLGIEFDGSEATVICDIITAFMDMHSDLGDVDETRPDDSNYDGENYAQTLFEMVSALRMARSDSMGRGSIVYWPRIEWTADMNDSDDNDSDDSDD